MIENASHKKMTTFFFFAFLTAIEKKLYETNTTKLRKIVLINKVKMDVCRIAEFLSFIQNLNWNKSLEFLSLSWVAFNTDGVE